MALSLQVGLKQTQKLVLTQSLRQAIEILQMSTLELSDLITGQLQENPVLEEESSPGLPPAHEQFQMLSGLNRNLSGDNSLETRSEEHRNKYDDLSDSGYRAVDYDDDRKRRFIENAVSREETLIEHLMWQARITASDDRELGVFETVITSLDRNGFFPFEIRDFSKENNIPEILLESVVNTIAGFDPVGCAKKDIQQSLIAQAHHFYPDDDVLHRILKDYFIDLEHLRYEKIAHELGIPGSDIVLKTKLLQNLDPYPGRQYSSKETRFIVPDLEVVFFENEIIVNLIDEWLPTVRINPYYIDLARKKGIDRKQKEYIQDKIQAAKFLMKNISGRRDTILRVVRAIMEHQFDFLVMGPGNLKPLTHLEIAEELGVHESTISRATSNKFVQTSWGVFELKYFFVSKLKGTASEKGMDQSSDRVKSIIQELISSEDVKRPLNDDELVKELKSRGVIVARRTVAKYRGVLNIPPASRRKKIHMMKSEEVV